MYSLMTHSSTKNSTSKQSLGLSPAIHKTSVLFEKSGSSVLDDQETKGTTSTHSKARDDLGMSASMVEEAKELERKHYARLAHLAAEAKRKEDEIEARLKVLNLEVEEAERNRKLIDSRTCVSADSKIDTSSTVPSDLGKTLTQLVNLQAAPKPTLDTFSGIH